MADQDFKIRVVTTADTSGIRQTSAGLAQLQKQSEGQAKAAEQAGYELGRALRVVAGGALIAGGYQFVSQLRSAAAEIEKIAVSLDKEGEQLVSNAQKFSEMAKFAKTNADVLKVGEGALKGVEAAHKRLLDAASQELTIWQKIADVWAAGFKDEGPIAQAKRLAFEQAAQNYELERQNAIRAVSEALRTKEALSARTYTQQIEFLNQKIAEQEAIQKRVGVARIEDYLKAGEAVENYRKILNDVTRAEQQRTRAQQDFLGRAADSSEKGIQRIRSSDQQVDAIFRNREAADRARARGDIRGGELLDKTADELLTKNPALSDAARRAVERYDEEQRALREPLHGRKAGAGESQDLIDQMARNQIDFQRQLRGELPLPGGPGLGPDPALQQALEQAFNNVVSRYWGP